jgi:hypothetical protein
VENVPEGLSPAEISKEINEHRQHTLADGHGQDRDGDQSQLLTIVEAVKLAKAATARTEANRYSEIADTTKDFDALTFDTWFTAYTVGNQTAMTVAERRFRPQFHVAFNAWLATDPFTNPNAPPGPTYMPQYIQPERAQINRLDAQADAYYAFGEAAGNNSDNYVRIVVYLATVLFLIGISSHFRVRSARIGLVVVGGAIMTFSIVLLVQAPKPSF